MDSFQPNELVYVTFNAIRSMVPAYVVRQEQESKTSRGIGGRYTILCKYGSKVVSNYQITKREREFNF